MTAETLVAALVALIIGLAAGWLLRARAAAAVETARAALADRVATLEDMRMAAISDLVRAEERAVQADTLREKLAALEIAHDEATRDLAALRADAAARAESVVEQIRLLKDAREERAGQADALREKLTTSEAARDSVARELAALRADAAARAESVAEQIKLLKDAREAMSAQFSETAGKMLAEAQRALAERNELRMSHVQEKSEASLKALLQPVESTLKRYEEGLGRVEKERVDSYAALREAVEQVRLGSAEARTETAKLVNALRSSPKARGRWGEQQLRNVLELAGLSPYADYRAEVSVDTEDGKLRPDVIVRLPGGRQLIIDAKCSLNAYQEAAEADDEAIRVARLRDHAGAIRNHAQQLGAKDYWTRFGDAADYVVMFIPGEHFLSAALEQDNGLWEWAFEKRVLIATPTNLVAIARTVASVWRQEKLAEEAAQIGALGKEMFERLSVAAGHLGALGRSLNSSVGSYNKFVASFENRVLVTGRKFRDLNIETGSREIETPDLIETQPRLPVATSEDASVADLSGDVAEAVRRIGAAVGGDTRLADLAK